MVFNFGSGQYYSRNIALNPKVPKNINFNVTIFNIFKYQNLAKV